MKNLLIWCWVLGTAGLANASGFGVFTQGASGLGQANAVVAHSSGASSLYFNPALINELPGQQLELGTTLVYAEHAVELAGGGTENSKDGLNFPSTAYYTQQLNDRWTVGLGLFFPFGLSTEWKDDFAGRYLGTYGELTTLNINPAVSYRVSERLSIAGGVSALYLDATLKNNINQTAAYTITDLTLSGGTGGALPPLSAPLNDIEQKFAGDGWGYGYNLGVLFKASERISLGAAYRSQIDVTAEGQARFAEVDPLLTSAFPQTGGQADIRLPAQATAGIALKALPDLIVEVGVRWEDWSSTDDLTVELSSPVFGQTANVTPRDWQATWSYHIGGQYRYTPALAFNAGYLYGQNAVPDSTFEPLVPDSDTHLFTLGAEWSRKAWTISGAVGYQYQQDRQKNNSLGDPLGSVLNGTPTGTANGTYTTDLYLTSLSLNYRF
jgi:long-chain fatty acid transport protein